MFDHHFTVLESLISINMSHNKEHKFWSKYLRHVNSQFKEFRVSQKWVSIISKIPSLESR